MLQGIWNRRTQAAMIGVLGLAGTAFGQGMPAGSMQWIKVEGNYPQATGAVQLPYPSPNYVTNPPWVSLGLTVYANGDSTANRMRNSYSRWRTDAVFLTNSMFDTYTITGPAGTQGTPVTAHVRMTTSGNLFVGPRPFGSGTIYCCSSYLQMKIGDWNPDTNATALEQFRVNPFDSNMQGTQSIPSQNYGSNQPIVPATLVVQGDVVRTVGVPFDLAYQMSTTSDGAGDVSGTPAPAANEYVNAFIHWDLPPGYHITSVRGWTDPDAPPPPPCGSADFNGDGDLGTDADIGAFFACLGGNCCATCDSHGPDFNGDGDLGTDGDIESFFRVLGGGAC
jgi:hypothetical protein